MKVLSFALVLRQMNALPRVLMLVARLGGKIAYISAADDRMTLSLVAPESVAHRFGPQLRRIIDVVELTEYAVEAQPCAARNA
jgi:hypothetical protein